MAYSQWSNLRRKTHKRVNAMLESLETEMSGNLETGLALDTAIENCPENSQFSDTPQSSQFADMVTEEGFSSDTGSDEISDDDSVSHPCLASALSHWATKFRVSSIALSALLSILRVHHPHLPKDGRTLLQTKTDYVVENLAGGSRWSHEHT